MSDSSGKQPQPPDVAAGELELWAEGLGTIARLAGGVILDIARKGMEQHKKPDGSMCTAADLAAEELIVAELARAFPGVPVVAEESAAEFDASLPARFFLVDPVDGTTDFIAGTGAYTVNIALIDNGLPIAGAIYAPTRAQLWIGGASARSRACPPDDSTPDTAWTQLRTRPAPEGGLTALASLRHGDPDTEQFLAALPIARRTSSSSSLKFCVIAEGEADVYPRFGRTMEWDTAAGQAILQAAGGVVLNPLGAPFSYGFSDAGFANGPFVAWGDPARAARHMAGG